MQKKNKKIQPFGIKEKNVRTILPSPALAVKKRTPKKKKKKTVGKNDSLIFYDLQSTFPSAEEG